MHSTTPFCPTLLAQHSGYLYRFALTRLSDSETARDAVQETLLAALESGACYAGKSSLRTWLTAILKHKIIDVYRRHARDSAPGPSAARIDSEMEPFGHNFSTRAEGLRPESGEAAANWGNPEDELEQKKFWLVVQQGLAELPPQASRAFVMRDVAGASTEEICRALRITSSNCWVILHRARLVMKAHMMRHWLQSDGQ